MLLLCRLHALSIYKPNIIIARLVNVSRGSAWAVWPSPAAYTNSKQAMFHYTTTVAASYPCTVLAIAINPGLNDTEVLPSAIRSAGFDYNEQALSGAVLAWLVANPTRSLFLNGRVVSFKWDLDEPVSQKEGITSNNLLTMQLNATLGLEQFADYSRYSVKLLGYATVVG
jgi:NAD(P)-dependent dehydrogenase (short-subunit alcohol dehydrogenase family)